MTIEELFKSYITYSKNRDRSPKTIRNYHHFYSKYIGPSMGRRLVEDIKLTDCYDLEGYVRKRNHSKSTPHYTVKLFQKMLKHAVVREGITMQFDFRNIELPRYKKGKTPVRLTPEEIELIREILSPDTHSGLRMRAFFELLLCSGMRGKEALTLNRKDINFTNGTVTISDSKNFEDNVVVKNIRGCEHWLKKYLKTRVDNDPALFYVEPYAGRGGKRMCGDTAAAYLKKLCSNPKLSGKSGTHIIRKTFITQMLLNTDVRTAQLAAGHKSARTTLTHYAAIEEWQALEQVQNIIPNSFQR